MARFFPLILLTFGVGLLICDNVVNACSLDIECLHFEHCCKGNCTSKRLQCKHICSSDHDCDSNNRCVLGLCVNCTDQISCDYKSCINDTHCPGTHSCKDKVCFLKKKGDLTSEMLPFIIFITALSVSLLIVCYNDYILERLGHRGCLECLENRICHCSLFLKIWMWRHQRLQQQRNDELTPSCPVEVRFDSRIVNPSNSSNEKRETSLFGSLASLKGRLMFWRRFDGSTQSNNRSNYTEETLENTNTVSNNQMVSPVVLLNEFMNTNEVVSGTSTTTQMVSNSINHSGMSEIRKHSLQDRNFSSKQAKDYSCPGEVTAPSSHLKSDDVNVNTTNGDTNSIKTESHFVTIV